MIQIPLNRLCTFTAGRISVFQRILEIGVITCQLDIKVIFLQCSNVKHLIRTIHVKRHKALIIDKLKIFMQFAIREFWNREVECACRLVKIRMPGTVCV